MEIDSQELASHYAAMSDAELNAVAHSYDSLTDAAQAAFQSELQRRGLPLSLAKNPPLSEEVSPAKRLVTVRRFRDLSEAIVARSLLESSGIEAYLFDENLVRLDWQISNFIGGIRLQVEAADEATAIELLNQPVPEEFEFGGEEEFVQPRCPHCQSTDITFEGASRGAALAALYAFSVPVPFGPKTWLCNNCGTRWEEIEEPVQE